VKNVITDVPSHHTTMLDFDCEPCMEIVASSPSMEATRSKCNLSYISGRTGSGTV